MGVVKPLAVGPDKGGNGREHLSVVGVPAVIVGYGHEAPAAGIPGRHLIAMAHGGDRNGMTVGLGHEPIAIDDEVRRVTGIRAGPEVAPPMSHHIVKP